MSTNVGKHSPYVYICTKPGSAGIAAAKFMKVSLLGIKFVTPKTQIAANEMKIPTVAYAFTLAALFENDTYPTIAAVTAAPKTCDTAPPLKKLANDPHFAS